jgi:uncharacterized protein YciI
LPAHLQWLEQHRATVLVAGSLRPEPEAAPVGACWVVESDSKADVEALLRTTPFWIGGLRASLLVEGVLRAQRAGLGAHRLTFIENSAKQGLPHHSGEPALSCEARGTAIPRDLDDRLRRACRPLPV